MEEDYQTEPAPAVEYLDGAVGMQTKMDHRMSVRRKLELRKKHLTAELESLTKLEKLLDENPAIEQFQDLVSKVGL